MAGPIRIAVLANASQAQRELSQTATTAEKISSKFAKLRAPATLALGAIGVGAKKAVDSASNLNEALSKNEQIFGKQAGAIEKFASTADTALGQSKTTALDAAATFGMIGQKAGLSGTETAKFSTKFTTLASDLASFNNTTPEEAITAIGAAMRGESEPIRKYGVLLDDATLKARAMKLGLIQTTTQALTPQQKALAASQEILAQTGKAQGDFARTSEGAANKGRIVAAQTENLSATLGESLLPAYQSVLGALSKFVGLAAEHSTTTKVAIIVIAALAAGVLAVSAASAVASAATTVYAVATGAAALASKAATAASLGTRLGLAALAVQTVVTSTVTKAAAAAQWLLNAAMLANPIGLVILAIVALVAIFVLAYKKSETFRAIVDKAWAGIKAATSAVWGFITRITKAVWSGLVAFVKNPVQAVKRVVSAAWNFIKNATSRVWSAIKSAISRAWSAITGVVTGAIAKVKRTITVAWTVVKAVTSRVWSAIKSAIGRAWSAIGNVVQNAVGKVKSFVSRGWDLVKSLTGRAWDAAKELVARAWDRIKTAVTTGIARVIGFVRDLPGKIKSALGNLGSLLLNAGKQIVQGLIDGIQSMIGTVQSKLSGLTNMIPNWKGPADRDKRLLTPAGQSIIQGLVDGLDEKIPEVRRVLSGLTREIGTFDASATASVDVSSAVSTLNARHTSKQTMTLRLTADQVDRLRRGQEIEADLSAWRAVGGTRRSR